jgi:dolichol-phosphate mannosyltransferase
VVIPTFNEVDNIQEIVDRLASCLGTISWEVIFVDDDSPDGTAQRVRTISRRDPRVRCLQRLGRRGLASACIEGMLATSAPFLAVMDGDLQHDESLLGRMLSILRKDIDTDIVVGSRYVEGGGVDRWARVRLVYSRLATRIGLYFSDADLRDPMSGFFMMRRQLLEQTMKRLSGIGFKILLDLVTSSKRPLRIIELPYEFRNRRRGRSKLDARAIWDYVMLLLDKRLGHIIPPRFILFALVGVTGVLVHLFVLMIAYRLAHAGFLVSHSMGCVTAMTSNFALHNFLTYRDMRLSGRAWWKGLALFAAICSIGAVANVGVAAVLLSRNALWLGSAAAGIAVGAVWNYAVGATYTWEASHRRIARTKTN